MIKPAVILLSYPELESFFKEPEWNSMIDAMKEYAKQYHEAKLKGELMKFRKFIDTEYGFEDAVPEGMILEYLKQRKP